MIDLIATAYGIDAGEVLSGPKWLESDRFDVIAKAPPSTPPETVSSLAEYHARQKSARGVFQFRGGPRKSS